MRPAKALERPPCRTGSSPPNERAPNRWAAKAGAPAVQARLERAAQIDGRRRRGAPAVRSSPRTRPINDGPAKARSARRANGSSPQDRRQSMRPAKALERPPCRTGCSPRTARPALKSMRPAKALERPPCRPGLPWPCPAGSPVTTTIAGSNADVPAVRPHRHVRGPASRSRPSRTARRPAPGGRRLHRPPHRRDAVSDARRRGGRRRRPRRSRADRGPTRVTAFVAGRPVPVLGDYVRLLRTLAYTYVWERWPDTDPDGTPAVPATERDER